MKASRLPPSFAAFLMTLCFALPLSSQGLFREIDPLRTPRVWTVDDSGGADFTDLPQAVLEAGAGDVLLVKAGNYTSFALNGKGLTILGDGGVPKVIGPVTVVELPAGQNLVLRGLDFEDGGAPHVLLRDNAGAVWIEDCTIYNTSPYGAYELQAKDNASVVLVRTDVFGAAFLPVPGSHASALHGVRSDVHAHESLFRAGDGNPTTTHGGAGDDGAQLEDAFLYAAGCTFRGGKGIQGGCAACSFPCNPLATAGGAGLNAAASGTPPITLACTFIGGTGGEGGGFQNCCPCPDGPTGPPTVGVVTVENLPLRSYRVTTPVRDGTSYQLVAKCQPGEFVWSVFSEDLDPTYVPNYFGTQVSPLPVTLVFEGVANGTGSLVKNVPVPPLAGLTSFERLFAQGLFFDALNNAYLGSPSVLVVVN